MNGFDVLLGLVLGCLFLWGVDRLQVRIDRERVQR